MAIRNEFEFRSALLTALGQEHTEAEAKNEETWRRKMLDGLGVEYNQNDVNQFGLFREKLVEGVENYSGGGGGSWQTVFEGSVTTEETPRGNIAQIAGYYISADNIKVTFNGTEYECPKISVESANVYGGFNESTQTPDFSEYPFSIMSVSEDGNVFFNFYTESTGTYTLKIEEEQSGGSSDFSTAEVTITNNSGEEVRFYLPVYMNIPEYGAIIQGFMMTDSEEPTFEGEVVIPTNGELYVGSSLAQFTTGNTTVTGNARVENGSLIITGDCTITIS